MGTARENTVGCRRLSQDHDLNTHVPLSALRPLGDIYPERKSTFLSPVTVVHFLLHRGQYQAFLGMAVSRDVVGAGTDDTPRVPVPSHHSVGHRTRNVNSPFQHFSADGRSGPSILTRSGGKVPVAGFDFLSRSRLALTGHL